MTKQPPSNMLPTLKHGRHSTTLKAWGNCAKCPVRNHCSVRETLSQTQQERGCDDIRQLFFENIRRYRTPGMELMRTIAELETRLAMQSMVDGEAEKLASREFMKLMELKEKFMRMALKIGGMADQQIKVVHTFDPGKDEPIPLDVEAYDSDEMPEKEPTMNTNTYRNHLDKMGEEE